MAEGLHATITADTKDFEVDLKRASQSADQLANSIRQASTQAGSFKPATSSAASGLTAVNKAAKSSTGAFRAMKGASTQLGFQLQDIAVQAQSGTSAFTILGQQGSQVASIFGPGGALLGAVIAISSAIGGVLFNSLTSASEATGDWREELDKTRNSLTSLSFMKLNDALFDTAARIDELSSEYERLDTLATTTWENNQTQGEAFRKKAEDVREELKRFVLLYKELEQQQGKLFAAGKLPALEDQAGDQKGGGASGDGKTQLQLMQERFNIIKQFQGMENAAQQEKLMIQHEQLRTALENQLITEQEYNQLKLEANAAYQEQIVEQENQAANRRIQLEQRVTDQINSMRSAAVGNAVGLLQQLGAKSKVAALAAIALQKGMMITETINSTLAAQMRAMAELGPIAGPPAAAAIGTWGKINAGLIAASGLYQAANLGGGGAAAGVQNGVQQGQQAVASQPQNQIVNINLEGEIFGRDQVRGLIGQINDALEDGYTLRV